MKKKYIFSVKISIIKQKYFTFSRSSSLINDTTPESDSIAKFAFELPSVIAYLTSPLTPKSMSLADTC